MISQPRRLLSSLGAVALALTASSARATTDDFCSFPAALTSFTLNQNAFQTGIEYRLTDAVPNETASVYLTAPIPIAAATSVHAHFKFQMGPSATGGEGIAFVMQNAAAGAAAIGTGVAGMGYGATTPSVDIQFNTLKDSGVDPNANNVSLILNGADTTAYTATAVPGFTMAGGGVLNGWVDYDGVGNTVSVYVAKSTTKPVTALFTHALNLYTQLGSAGHMYVGFTSATGATAAASNQHDVYALEISTSGIPCTCEGDSACGGATPACAASGICATCSATNSTACTGATPICDVPTNTCVGCLTDANCSGATPICDVTTLVCRACVAADCTGAKGQCATSGASAGSCVVCTADANCPPTTPRCSATNTCVQCLSATDCGGDTPICNANACKACASDADCAATPSTPACEVWGACGQCTSTNVTACTGGTAVCDYPTGTCVGCEFNSDCSGSLPTCNAATHTCHACMTNADCAGNPAGQACVTSGMKAGSCVTCEADSDCASDPAAPKCDTVANRCVQCLASADCPADAGTPACNASNLCVGCLTASDCTTAMPVCNLASSQCTTCMNDYSATNPGSLPCPTAALPACQLAGADSGTSITGECAVCSSVNDSVCATESATPVCIAASAVCGCAKDTDCNADSYCDTATTSTGVCTTGCRVLDGGVDNCSTGEFCTKTDGSVGVCMGQPCNSNTDCKAPTPVCNTIVQPHTCTQCLNNSDCAGGDVCDPTNHCAVCSPTKTANCKASGTGAACLANETCGCATDSDCGAGTSGRVCNASTHVCEAGCRGTGGNGCPAGDTCSSTNATVGKCSGTVTPPGMDAGVKVDSGGTATAPGKSSGCSCRAAGAPNGRGLGALVGVVLGVAFAVRRRGRRRGRRRAA